MKHTKGPMFFSIGSNPIDAECACEAVIFCPLHAAAQEMLEALRSISEVIDDVMTLTVSHAAGFHQIKRTTTSVIAKAEGK